MRFRTPDRVIACFLAATAVVIAGCAPYGGNRYTPIGYGPNGTPIYPVGRNPQGGHFPVNYPGGNPPIVWNPGSPLPTNPLPTNPIPNNPKPPENPVVLQPIPKPDPNPNIPVNFPTPTHPNSPDVTAKWVPWPLPPRAAALSQNLTTRSEVKTDQSQGLPHTAAVRPDSEAAEKYVVAAEATEGQVPDNDRRINGTHSTPGRDLRYRGGRTIQNMSYVNLYVGGEAAGWKLDEVEKIDTSLEAALTDIHLNYVIMQYFNNQPIGTTARPSHPLVGPKPSVVSRGDIQHYMEYLSDQGYLNSYDLNNTIFNFLLPPGTILNDEDQPENAAYTGTDRPGEPVVEHGEADDSTGGLGGYHGSIHHSNRTLYYSVEVYSERRSDGFSNGIPVFPDPWKNICATLYHELCEFRTDPDVEDAIRDPYNPASERFLGWTSDAGEEIGDYPLHAGVTLKDVVTEVPLANGKGTVPVQFNYSNAVHGPQGPITALNPPAVR